MTPLENTESYRRDLRRVGYGDERVPQQLANLREISPLTQADEIRMPLMVATRANDPRVLVEDPRDVNPPNVINLRCCFDAV